MQARMRALWERVYPLPQGLANPEESSTSPHLALFGHYPRPVSRIHQHPANPALRRVVIKPVRLACKHLLGKRRQPQRSLRPGLCGAFQQQRLWRVDQRLQQQAGQAGEYANQERKR